MAKSSPEKLARALRANLKRRKDPNAQHGPDEGPRSPAAPGNQSLPDLRQASEKSLKNSG